MPAALLGTVLVSVSAVKAAQKTAACGSRATTDFTGLTFDLFVHANIE
jgi:hypothetical protein